MSGCGCRVEWNNYRDPQEQIVYCPLHERAARLAALAEKFLAPYPDQCECAPGFTTDAHTFPTLVCAYCDARALLREIGR